MSMTCIALAAVPALLAFGSVLPGVGLAAEPVTQRGPFFLHVERGSGLLLVLCEKSDTIVRIDPQTGELVSELATGESPFALCEHPDGRRLYVSCRRGQEVIELDAESLKTLRRFPLVGDPTGVAVSADGRRLYIGVHSLDQIAVFALESGVEIKRLAAGNGPEMIRLSRHEGRVYVTNLLPNIGPPDQPCKNEITVIDDATARVVERIILVNANVGRHIDFTSDGLLAVAAISRPKNLIPMTQVARGWVVTNGFVVLSPGGEREPVQLLVDLPNQAYADPYGVAIMPDDSKFYLSSAGLDFVLAVDLKRVGEVMEEALSGRIPRYADHLGLSRRYVTSRIAVGANPQALAISTDGRSLYVANRLDDSISVIDTATDRVVRTLVLAPAFDDAAGAAAMKHQFHMTGRAFEGQFACARCHENVNTHRVVQGERMFHSAARAFQGQFTCVSCHPDLGFDGLQYDLEPDGIGRNIVDNRNLRGVGGTGPFKWNGKNPDITDQCGTRTAKWIMRTGWLNSVHVVALAEFIRSIELVVNPYRLPDRQLTAAQRRGKAVFERTVTNDGTLIHEMDRCNVCHGNAPVFFRQEIFDVGSKQPNDSPSAFFSEAAMAGPDRRALSRAGTMTAYDTAHLTNVFESAPFMHHGKAATLEEIWTKYDPEGRHGATRDLTKQQFNDLIEYLKTL